MMEAVFNAVADSIGADGVVTRVIPWVAFWHCLFWLSCIASPFLFSTYGKLDGAMKAYWAASIVSTIHAVYIVYLAAISFIKLDALNSTDFFGVDETSSFSNIVFIAYLISDLVLSLFYNKQWPGYQANIIHHVTGIICWYILEKDAFGHVFSLTALLTEATTPFINQRFFFDKAGMKTGVVYLANGLLMTLLWFLLRVCLFGWVGYRIFVMRDAVASLQLYQQVAVLSSYVVGYALQLFWFSKIFKGALKAISKKQGSSEKAA